MCVKEDSMSRYDIKGVIKNRVSIFKKCCILDISGLGIKKYAGKAGGN